VGNDRLFQNFSDSLIRCDNNFRCLPSAHSRDLESRRDLIRQKEAVVIGIWFFVAL
jgi:hypothetical protein